MAPANNQHKDTSSRHRSHKGCWTCKKKRIQCDETRPGCRRCTERGLTCEGYEIRLRWGAGIASRGRFSGAEKPTKESIPPPSRRRWDLRTKGEQREGDQQGQPVLLLQRTTESINTTTSPLIVCVRDKANIIQPNRWIYSTNKSSSDRQSTSSTLHMGRTQPSTLALKNTSNCPYQPAWQETKLSYLPSPGCPSTKKA